jgi:prepilin-type N-terminal cleavage/methylation domain-containing protein
MKPHAKSSPRTGEAGFSLIELLVVVAIMTAVLAASIPSLRSHTESVNLMKGTEALAGTLKLARQRAVPTSNDVVVVFDTAGGTYYLYEDADGDGTYDTGETRSGTYDVPKRVTIDAVSFAGDTVTFSPTGAASETGSIVLVNTRDRARRIDLTAAAGLVYITDVYAFGG